MNREDALRLLNSESMKATDVADIISFAHRIWHSQPNQSEALDLIIRIESHRSKFDNLLEGAGLLIDDILRFSGLYPYISSDSSFENNFVRKAMSLDVVPEFIFHKGQIEALGKLLNGKSLILSAPTSFGKSLLVDTLIKVKEYESIIIIVPTLSLLDEYRKRLSKKFPLYDIVTRPNDKVIRKGKRIFLGTQERIETRDDIKEVDLFIIDEFYKLDLRRGGERASFLNNVLAKYAAISKQIYLLGPSIDSVNSEEMKSLNIDFFKTSYSPVAVDVIRRQATAVERDGALVDLLHELKGEKTLVYFRSPRATYKCGLDIIPEYEAKNNSFNAGLARWIGENYHPDWVLVDCLKKGVGIHHGRIPRSIAQFQINQFNNGCIDVLMCTSSMIEGVNTAAKNVVIFDNYISRDKLDRFTFDNIKGRAGRMFQHFVGRVFLFGDAPLISDVDVEIPLFNGFENASDDVLLSVPSAALSPRAARRRQNIVERSMLSEKLLSKWGRFSLDGLESLAEEMSDRRKDAKLAWSGQGTYEEMSAVFELAWDHLIFSRHDFRSGKAAAFFSSRLRSAGSLAEFLSGVVRDEEGIARQLSIDRGLNFLRAAEFTLPQVLLAINDIAVELNINADYSILAGRLPSWFARHNFAEMEEYGIPFPVAQREGISLNSGDRFMAERINLNTIASTMEREILKANLA